MCIGTVCNIWRVLVCAVFAKVVFEWKWHRMSDVNSCCSMLIEKKVGRAQER